MHSYFVALLISYLWVCFTFRHPTIRRKNAALCGETNMRRIFKQSVSLLFRMSKTNIPDIQYSTAIHTRYTSNSEAIQSCSETFILESNAFHLSCIRAVADNISTCTRSHTHILSSCCAFPKQITNFSHFRTAVHYRTTKTRKVIVVVVVVVATYYLWIWRWHRVAAACDCNSFSLYLWFIAMYDVGTLRRKRTRELNVQTPFLLVRIPHGRRNQQFSATIFIVGDLRLACHE